MLNVFGFKKRTYLDYASATPVLPAALRAFSAASTSYANPGAIHKDGVEAKKILETAREKIARELACKAREVVFVSGGTEANNLAIVGYARKLEKIRRTLSGTHWIVSAIEHPSVLECFSEVERLGGEVTHVAPDSRGRITVEAVEKALKKETVFVSVGWANHEIGTIQHLSDISRAIRSCELAHKTQVIFHADASQAPLYIAPQVHTLGVDLLSLDAGKLYAPRGIGALYISSRTELSSVLFGGKQERGLRPGSENLALAHAFSIAMEKISAERKSEAARLRTLREKLRKQISDRFPGAFFNGDEGKSLPHILNVSIPDIDAEYVTLALDSKGFAVSTKSACREGEESESHVVRALLGEGAVDTWRSRSTIRISLGRETTMRAIMKFVSALEACVDLSRRQKLV